MRLALIVALVAAQCNSSAPVAPAPSPDPTSTVTIPDPSPSADAGTDPIALELCVENFEALNPCVPDLSCLSKVQLQAIFCATPEDLAPWAKQAALNAHPRALAR